MGGRPHFILWSYDGTKHLYHHENLWLLDDNLDPEKSYGWVISDSALPPFRGWTLWDEDAGAIPIHIYLCIYVYICMGGYLYRGNICRSISVIICLPIYIYTCTHAVIYEPYYICFNMSAVI